MYQNETSHTACYTYNLLKKHIFLLIEGLSMYKKSSCLDQKTGSVSNYIEYAFSFMPNYLHLTSFSVHGETFNQQEPMIFCQFASVGGRV